MTKPGTAQPDTRRRRASTGQLMDGIMRLARQLPLTRQVLAEQLDEYLTCWGPGLLRLGAIMSFGGYCVSRPGLLRLGAVVG